MGTGGEADAGEAVSVDGHDFSDVRVHTGDVAARAARAISASAYTVGRHIVFAGGAYNPHGATGRGLLAHELTHVVQQRRNPALAAAAVHRKRCPHDGQETGCYAFPAPGRVELTDTATGTAADFDIGDLVVQNMQSRFGGTWLTRLQGPPPTIKSAKNHGFMDGVKIQLGSALDAEIVEVKARSNLGGGGNQADLEAEDYRQQLDAISGHFVGMSAGLSAAGGLRSPKGNSPSDLRVGELRLLASLGVTPADPKSWRAWVFYNGLQNRLNRTFTTPFSALNATLNASGDSTATYEASPPWQITCTRRGKRRKGTKTLVYQVTRNGGASYGCNEECSDEEEDEKRVQDQPGVRPGDRRGKLRVTQEGEEPTIREPGEPGQPGQPGQPVKDPPTAPADTPTAPGAPGQERKDAPGQTGEPAQVAPRSAPGATPGAPAPSGEANPSMIPELLVAAAVLAAAARQAGIKQAERAVLEAAYKRTMMQLAERGAVSTAERLMINGVKLGSRALEDTFAKSAAQALEKDCERMTEKQLEKLALKEGEVLLKQEGKQLGKAAAKQVGRKIAGKALARAIPYLSVLFVAADALAAADHVSKGGTIEFGLSGSDVDLSGSTKVKDKGAPKAGASTEAKLTDTKIDIETSGIPDISGSLEIDAKNVTITGASRGDGTPVTVNFKAKLSNSTITITHGGVLRGGKVVFGGDVTITDSQIEIDLPPEATAPPPSAAPVVISGRKLKITKAGSGGAGGGATGAGTGAPAAGAPPTTATPPPVTPGTPPPSGTAPPPIATAPPAPELQSLSAGARSRIAAAGRPGEALIAAMIKQGTKGPKVDEASVDAILRVLADQHVTAEEMDKLRARIGPEAESLNSLLTALTKNIQQLRSTPAAPDPSAQDSATPADPAAPTQAKPFDPKDPKFAKLKVGQFWIGWQASTVPAAGALLTSLPGLGRTALGDPYEFTLSLRVVKVSDANAQGANLDVEVVSSSAFTMATGQQPSTFTTGRRLQVRLTLTAKP